MLGFAAISETAISEVPGAATPPSGPPGGFATSGGLLALAGTGTPGAPASGTSEPVRARGDSDPAGPRSGSATPPTARAGAAT